MNIVLRLIKRHYSGNELKRSDAQIERERTYFCGVPFNRWSLFPAAVLTQFCCGSLYAWSVFNKPIDTIINGDPNADKAPITFYIAVGCFGLSSAIMGPWLERNGPRMGVLLGSTLFFLGNLLAALAIHVKHMWLVYVGYGLVAGFGLGLSYISPVSALQKWFPDHRGMASGFAVCGFGAGSIAIAKIPGPLSKAAGLPLTFVILGACYFVCMVFSAYILRIPPPDYAVKGVNSEGEKADQPVASAPVMKEQPSGAPAAGHYHAVDINEPKPSEPPTRIKLTLIESLTSREFLILYVVFFANSVFGLVAISRLNDMIVNYFGKDADTASTIVSINGGVNLFGRLAFATVSDVFTRKICYVIMLSLQVIGLILLPIFTTHQVYPAFLVVIFIITACYGGGFGVIPAFLTDMFGSKNIGACHGVILTAWAIAGVAGGLIFTRVYQDQLISHGGTHTVNDPYSTNINVYWILAICIVGWIFILFSRTTVRDRLFPEAKGEIMRIRLFGRILRVSKSQGIQYLSKAEEDRIWREYWASKSS
ncbi:oxalate/formate antiporter [Syncephalis pseudoplumigaleata]|uniref:Oxalate/formate antiporter n=1 Tax=Syncephalis pseudoplumigaleata TaxID=1712513 RepID=A0A4P9YU50_9FUNG|nr:oxalate/formate antiporter [Syncephalis pseudoplumigaleata]|eukprot:RKP22370.1 oxalate/formate antiporter [Syncephalis pseudoplumigaleata]